MVCTRFEHSVFIKTNMGLKTASAVFQCPTSNVQEHIVLHACVCLPGCLYVSVQTLPCLLTFDLY